MLSETKGCRISSNSGSGYEGANERQQRTNNDERSEKKPTVHSHNRFISLRLYNPVAVRKKRTMHRYSIIEREHEIKCYVNTSLGVFFLFLLLLRSAAAVFWLRQHWTRIEKGKRAVKRMQYYIFFFTSTTSQIRTLLTNTIKKTVLCAIEC